MIGLLYIIGLILLVHGSYQLLKYFIVVSEIKKKGMAMEKSKNPPNFYKIFVLAPVLHEEKIIEKFLFGLSQQNYSRDLYEIFVITTQREYLSGEKPNTIDIIESTRNSLENKNVDIEYLHYPSIVGFKAEQLNFAFNYIRRKIGDKKIQESFFIVVDADLDVSNEIVKVFADSIEEGAEIYQRPLLWVKNFDKLENPSMRGFALLQSFFSISYEMPMFIGKFFNYRIKYFIGSSFCVKGSFLLRVGGFPSIIEDVRIGRMSSFLGAKAKLVPGFGVVETSKNFSVYIKQCSVWFFGCGLFLNDYFFARKLYKNISIRKRFEDCLLIFYGFLKAFRWLNKGLLHLVGIVISVVIYQPLLILLYLFSLAVNTVIPAFIISNDLRNGLGAFPDGKKKITKFFIQGIIASPIIYMFNFIGPYYGLLKLFNFYIWKKISLPKTER